MAGGPDFDVVGLRGAEADVAGAEFDDLVVQAEGLQDALGVGGERVEFGEGLLRLHDFHQLHFVELMHADHAARADAGGSGFAAETGRVGDVTLRQIGGREDFVAVEIRDGDFGGGHEEDVVLAAVVELVAEFRELAGAFERVRADEERRAHFHVAVIARVQIEAEIDERPQQPRAEPGVTDETAAADLRGAFEIEEPELFAEFYVIERVRDLRLFAPRFDDGILARIVADGRGVVREIGKAEQHRALRVFGFSRLAIQLADFLADGADVRLDFARVLALTLLRADLLGNAFAVALQALEFRLAPPPGRVDFEHGVDLQMERAAARGEALFYVVGVVADEADVEHSPSLSGGLRRWQGAQRVEMLRDGAHEEFAVKRGVFSQRGAESGGLRLRGDVQELASAGFVEKGMLEFRVGDFREKAHVFLVRGNGCADFVERKLLLRGAEDFPKARGLDARDGAQPGHPREARRFHMQQIAALASQRRQHRKLLLRVRKAEPVIPRQPRHRRVRRHRALELHRVALKIHRRLKRPRPAQCQ